MPTPVAEAVAEGDEKALSVVTCTPAGWAAEGVYEEISPCSKDDHSISSVRCRIRKTGPGGAWFDAPRT